MIKKCIIETYYQSHYNIKKNIILKFVIIFLFIYLILFMYKLKNNNFINKLLETYIYKV